MSLKTDLTDPLIYIPKYFCIIAKPEQGKAESKLVNMNLYKAQEYWIKNRTARDIILKPRQIRISTAVMAANAHLLFTSPYQRQTIIANDDETATFLLTTIERFWRNLPEHLRPATDWKSGAHMRFPALDSYIYIDSAKSDTIGIGHGLNCAHLCLHPDSLILLSNGYMKPIKEVEADDCSYSKKNGNLVRVKNVYIRSYKGKLCKLTFYGNPATPLICTPEHRVIGKSDKGGWLRADETQWLGSPIRKITEKMTTIPLWHYTAGNDKAYVECGSVELDKEFGWIVGLYYAEGCHKGGHKGVIYGLSTKETDFRDKIISFCKKHGWGVSSRVIDTHGVIKGREINGKSLVVEVNSHEFGMLISGISGQGQDKSIPDWFWDCPKEFLDGVIDGYVDGDGSYSAKDERYYVTSVRPQLLYQLREMLLSVRNEYGGISYSKARQAWCLIFPMLPCKGNKHYKDGTYKFVKFGRIYRQPYVFVKLRSREYIDYDGEVYDLETKGSFKTPSGMVHNSEFARWPVRKADQLFADISQTIPPNAGYITIESTPQGRNKFYELYDAAKRGDTDYKAFFFPWWWVEDYWLPLKEGVKFEPTKEEKILMETYQLSPQQIQFRRVKIAEIKELFFQEYPENDVDCLMPNSLVMLGDGTTKKIQWLVDNKYSGDVLSISGDGSIVKRKVLGWHRSPRRSRDLYRLSYDHAKNTCHGGKTSVVITQDHKVLTQHGWVEAQDLRNGEFISTGTPAPDKRTEQLILGTILGDGCVCRRKLSITQSVHAWTLYKTKLLDSFSPKVCHEAKHNHLTMYTKPYPYFDWLREQFYPKGKKIVNRELISRLDDFGIAVWFLDDGNTRFRETGRPLSEISTGVLPIEDVDWLCGLLSSKGYSCKRLQCSNPKYSKIQFSADGTALLLSKIAKYVPEDMRYKLPVGCEPFNPSFYEAESPLDFMDSCLVTKIPVPQQKRGGKHWDKYKTLFCIDVEETHNFVTLGGTVHNCWLSSEISIIDAATLRRYYPFVKPGVEEGNLTIWKDVIGGKNYKIGVDVASGVAKGDYSVASVIETRSNEYVARLRGRIAPDLFAEQVYRLGLRYNTAEIGVERAGHGHTVLHVLLDKNYPNIYYHRDYDMVLKQESSQPGWRTTIKTKPMMVDDLVTALRAQDLISYSDNLLFEAGGLTWNGQKIEKPPGGYDDEWDALSIALQLRGSAPLIEPERATSVRSYVTI